MLVIVTLVLAYAEGVKIRPNSCFHLVLFCWNFTWEPSWDWKLHFIPILISKKENSLHMNKFVLTELLKTCIIKKLSFSGLYNIGFSYVCYQIARISYRAVFGIWNRGYYSAFVVSNFFWVVGKLRIKKSTVVYYVLYFSAFTCVNHKAK